MVMDTPSRYVPRDGKRPDNYIKQSYDSSIVTKITLCMPAVFQRSLPPLSWMLTEKLIKS